MKWISINFFCIYEQFKTCWTYNVSKDVENDCSYLKSCLWTYHYHSNFMCVGFPSTKKEYILLQIAGSFRSEANINKLVRTNCSLNFKMYFLVQTNSVCMQLMFFLVFLFGCKHEKFWAIAFKDDPIIFPRLAPAIVRFCSYLQFFFC